MMSFGGRFGVRAKLTAVLLALSAAGLVGAWAIYENAAEVHLPSASAQSDKDMDADLADVERMLARTPPEAGRFEVIEQANLFSPERKALPRLAEGKADAPQEAPKDMSLLGTTLLGKEKRAMLRIDQQQPPLVIVREGQSLGGDTQVVSIERGLVQLRRGGETVTLALPAPDPARPGAKQGDAQDAQPEGARPQQPAKPSAKGGPANNDAATRAAAAKATAAKAAAARAAAPKPQVQAKPAPPAGQPPAQSPAQNGGQAPTQNAGQPAAPSAGWSVKN